MSTIVDGKEIAAVVADQLKKEIESFDAVPQLNIVTVGNDAVMQSFVRSKKRFAEKVGIQCVEHNFDASVSETKLLAAVQKIQEERAAVIVQLPLPAHINASTILSAIPTEKDADVLNPVSYVAFLQRQLPITPPVASAIFKILDYYAIDVRSKSVVIVGNGKLVGMPTASLAQERGATVTVLDETTPKDVYAGVLMQADIVVSGVGHAGLIQPEMVQDGVVLIDAGTSTVGGSIEGDIAPSCAEKAALFSPTPGGVGPVTVAMLFENVVRVWA